MFRFSWYVIYYKRNRRYKHGKETRDMTRVQVLKNAFI